MQIFSKANTTKKLKRALQPVGSISYHYFVVKQRTVRSKFQRSHIPTKKVSWKKYTGTCNLIVANFIILFIPTEIKTEQNDSFRRANTSLTLIYCCHCRLQLSWLSVYIPWLNLDTFKLNPSMLEHTSCSKAKSTTLLLFYYKFHPFSFLVW